jgi:hypothetical protein
MIESHAFLAAFLLQILVVSVLNPARLIKHVRGWVANFGSQRFAELYPDFEYGQWAERFATRYRAANFLITVLGVLLLGWLYTLTRHPQWVDEVTKPVLVYYFLQMSPVVLLGLYAVVRYHKVLLQPSQEVKRKAMLQRRGLFDFVSPVAVLVAVIGYFTFVAFAIYLDLVVHRNEALSRACLGAIGAVTLVYAVNAFIVYKYLYGRRNPLVTHEGRLHTIGVRVKGSVYSCIVVVGFISLMGTLARPELREWSPFALSVFFVIITLLGFRDLTAPTGRHEADTLDSGEVRS